MKKRLLKLQQCSRKLFISSVLFFVISLIANYFAEIAKASPISNKFVKNYQAKWISSSRTSCDSICKQNQLLAESINISRVGTQLVHVCRVFTATQNYFGENTSDNCMYLDGNTRAGAKAVQFECLCVKDVVTGPRILGIL